MPRKKPNLELVPGKKSAASARSARSPSRSTPQAAASAKAPPQVSARWLLLAVAGTLAGAALCAWGALCLLFWQGNWQLLYHPSATLPRTPASANLAFESIGFATTPSGVPRLSGWWIPAAPGAADSRYTILYLHDKDGNLSDAVDHLAQLHAAGVNVFAFDYRGYGRSQFAHPSEKHWLEDAASAYAYLTATRHIDPHTLVIDGRGLGADLALEFARSHSEAAGVVAESPLEDAASAIFDDGRAHLVPAHLLARDRWDFADAAEALHIPSLWFLPFPASPQNGGLARNPAFFEKVPAPKMFVWLPPGRVNTVNFTEEFSRWLDSLALSNPQSAAPAPAQKPKSTRRSSHRRRAHATASH
jgi:uncharacterized protein